MPKRRVVMKVITYGEFLDKVHGCWYGKCLGGAAGAPSQVHRFVLNKRAQ